ncbi:hypothetical protein HDV04_004128 [Boothiomyces sp. JEL0838]|nr:hypothetical protein HDV04_004128 [Boothiomyces sp. JEL0838]
MKYLQSQSSLLEYQIKIFYPLSGLDRIFIATCSDKQSAFLIQNYSEITIFKFKTTAYGEISITATEENFEGKCNLIAGNSSAHNYQTCGFCTNHKLVEFHGMVDKGYKVFYQTWKDLFRFRNSQSSMMSVSLQHYQIQPSWDASGIIDPQVDVTRYGLRWTRDDVNIFKALWESRKHPDQDPTIQKPKIYNPWV